MNNIYMQEFNSSNLLINEKQCLYHSMHGYCHDTVIDCL
jgi:hypothetical protein